MSTIVGGLRVRLVRESIFFMLWQALADLGWFDLTAEYGGARRHKPIQFTGDIVAQDQEIALNTLALSDEDLSEFDLELGSTGVETRWTFFVDFFAENDSVGRHLINDVRDILAGRMSSIGRDDPSVLVHDYRLATPEELFRVQLERIRIDRAHDFPKPWQKHWFACQFDVVDAYHDEAA